MTLSAAIDAAISLAETNGNSLLEVVTGWTKVREVAYMKEPLSDFIRAQLRSDMKLRYWRTDPTPHNKAEEGFTDDEEKVSVSFPVLSKDVTVSA